MAPGIFGTSVDVMILFIFLLSNLAHHQPQAYNQTFTHQTFSHFWLFFSDLMVTSGGLQ
jgi:hypothetical protein